MPRREGLRVTASNMDARLEALDQRSQVPDAGREKGRAEPQGRAAEAAEGVDSRLAERPAGISSRHEDAEVPADRRRSPRAGCIRLAVRPGWTERRRSRPATPPTARSCSKPAAAWRATPWVRPAVGGEFAANLTRLGEKAGYDYIVRWVHNPARAHPAVLRRERSGTSVRRTTPRTAADSSSTWITHAAQTTATQLQVQNLTVMPSLRLSTQDARDIATYLTSLKRAGASYPADVAFMDDPQLAARGRQAGLALRMRQLPRDPGARRCSAHRDGTHQGSQQAHRAARFRTARAARRRRRSGTPTRASSSTSCRTPRSTTRAARKLPKIACACRTSP